MQSEKNSQIDTGEFKAQLLKKVGQERFKRYFHCLNRFINQNLSKSDFDKSCYRILGRENLPLHNQIIRVILRNACSAKTPPSPNHEAGPANKAVIAGGRISPALEDGHGQGTVMGPHHSSVAPIWSNGVVPLSPRKGRSTIRDRKLRDRPSPLGPNGKVDSLSHHSIATDDIGAKYLENGDIAPCDYQRPLHQPRGRAEQSENDERLVIKKPTDVSRVVRGFHQNNAGAVEDEVEHATEMKFLRSSLIAPLGIPFHSACTDGARNALPVTHVGDYVSCVDLDGLSDSEMLRRRIEPIVAARGLGVTLECANTLNNMVDVYLKRLIRSCLDLVGSRSTSNTSTYPVQHRQMQGKPINGLWPTNDPHMQNSNGVLDAHRLNQSVSLLDFKVAMELNPQQLGENWPLLLEKISLQGSEE
ncbi:hypothetical protein RND81_08G189000 [Saponaria officinalis]|uniref:Transcriptional coactivator Hfi1/Transcriptional adapter 1 n=1 Tax=Saponaria officinalis TaxID=3572 RepID=A0AAW1J9L2_SAPOF